MNKKDLTENKHDGVKNNLNYLARGIKTLSHHFMFIIMIILFVAVFVAIRFERNGYLPESSVLIALAALLIVVAAFYLWCKRKRDN